MDEPALVLAARRGDRDAFAQLVERYSRAVLARQYGSTRDLASAEDLTQETFVRVWRGLAKLEDPRAFGSWTLAIAGFVAQEWIRRKQTEARARMNLPPPTAAYRPSEGSDLPLAEAVARLPADVQAMLALRHDRGLSCEEIARELGKPIGTVTKTLSRAYEDLRARLVKR